MAGVVAQQFLGTKSTSEADRFRKRSPKLVCLGENKIQMLYLMIGITKIMLSTRQVLKTNRFSHRQMSLGTVLLFKLPL